MRGIACLSIELVVWTGYCPDSRDDSAQHLPVDPAQVQDSVIQLAEELDAEG